LELADLFLDTFPYNAGTIASDAIRMGLPLLTLSGRSFASRMAASLLRGIGAETGIADTIASYRATAIALARDPAQHRDFRTHFTEVAWQRSLGDIAGFTASLEARFRGLAAVGAAMPLEPS
jgi:predicted O-linked N-acetylglucosamine transferase (SPINDLY family)